MAAIFLIEVAAAAGCVRLERTQVVAVVVDIDHVLAGRQQTRPALRREKGRGDRSGLRDAPFATTGHAVSTKHLRWHHAAAHRLYVPQTERAVVGGGQNRAIAHGVHGVDGEIVTFERSHRAGRVFSSVQSQQRALRGGCHDHVGPQLRLPVDPVALIDCRQINFKY